LTPLCTFCDAPCWVDYLATQALGGPRLMPINLAALVPKLVALGASAEVVSAVILAVEEDRAGRREYERQRKRIYRNTNKINAHVPGTSHNVPGTEIPQQNQYPPSEVIPPHTPPTQNQRRVLSSITVDWRPNMAGIMLADQVGITGKELEEEIERFRNHYLSEGKELADWQPRWLNWLKSPHRKNGGSTYVERARKRTTDDVCRDLLDEIDRRERQGQAGPGAVHREPNPDFVSILPPRQYSKP
jgi:hypothetical protein